MARVKFFNPKTGKWEYADSAYGSGGTVTDEQIASAVEDYMAEHPIEVPDLSKNISLGFHTDGKLYVMVSGVPVGNGVEINGTVTPNETITLSDGTQLTTLMFSDDFDGDELNDTWKATHGNNDSSYITSWWLDRPENVGVSDSNLRLTLLRDNPIEGRELSSGKVETTTYGNQANYTWDTGYCEIRFMVDRVGDGIWPAIWSIGDTMSCTYTRINDTLSRRKIHGLKWPWSGEIDQLDAMYSNFRPTLIYQTDFYDSSWHSMYGPESYTLEANRWYTIGVYKTKDIIKMYLDRELIAEFDISDNWCFSGMAHNIVLQLNTGGAGGQLPEGIDEVNMYVDYVRVYSLGDSYVTMAAQNTASLLPDCADGYTVTADRKFLLRPQYAENTQNCALFWASSNDAVATVENAYVTTIGDGVCVITATDMDGNEVIRFPLTVQANAGIMATALKITSTVEAIEAGGTAEITANIYPTHCDSLTPELEIISGSEYCAISGLTITNTNTTAQHQNVVIRVKTNNPEVYEDITLSMRVNVDYTITPADNLLCNYNATGMSVYSQSGGVVWEDSLGYGNTHTWKSSNVNLTGNAVVGSNALWNFNSSNNSDITDKIPNEFTAVLLAQFDGQAEAIRFHDGTNYLRLNADSKINIKCGEVQTYTIKNDMKGAPVVCALSYSGGTITGYAVDADGNVSSADYTATTLVSSDLITGISITAGKISNGFIGTVYQMLLFDKKLNDDEVGHYAAQLFEKNL